MGSVRASVTYGIWMFFLCITNVTSTATSNKCAARDCLRCADDVCVKCARLIVLGSRACVDSCPAGYREEWSSLVDYMGRVCREASVWGLPGRTLAVIVGACSGAFICAFALLVGLLYVRRRRRKLRRLLAEEESSRAPSGPPSLPPSHRGSLAAAAAAADLARARSRSRSDSIAAAAALDTPERREFLKHISVLRCEAPVFLAMLNDTRRQVRELRRPDHANDSAIQAYRPVLRDLARILILLNRSEDRILTPPADWDTLLSWGERVLRRYKKQNPHQVAQAQLVNFLQVPIQTNPSSPCINIEQESNRRELTTFQPYNSNKAAGLNSSFKSNGNNHTMARASNQSLQELAISTFNSNYNNAPMANTFNSSNEVVLRREVSMLQPSLIDSANEFSPWEFNPSNYTTLAEWSASRDYLVDDDFFTLGFRPQDEITTEL